MAKTVASRLLGLCELLVLPPVTPSAGQEGWHLLEGPSAPATGLLAKHRKWPAARRRCSERRSLSPLSARFQAHLPALGSKINRTLISPKKLVPLNHLRVGCCTLFLIIVCLFLAAAGSQLAVDTVAEFSRPVYRSCKSPWLAEGVSSSV